MGAGASATSLDAVVRTESVEDIASVLNGLDGEQHERLLAALTKHPTALCGNAANPKESFEDGEHRKSILDRSFEKNMSVLDAALENVDESSPYDLTKPHEAVTDKTTTVLVEGQFFRVPSCYEPVRLLGSGAFGTVAEFSDGSGQKVAVKKISDIFNDDADVAEANTILREIVLLRHLDHENVCQLVGLLRPLSPDFNEIYLVMGVMDTDLHNIIQSDQDLSDDVVRFFAYQVLVGLKYLHSAKVVHRDLKPRNLLVNGDCHLKICDFGWARVLEEHAATIINNEASVLCDHTSSKQASRFLTQTNVVTLWYRAPEVVLSSTYSLGVDVFSAGCVLAEIVARLALFESRSVPEHLMLMMCVLGVPSEDNMIDFTMSDDTLKNLMKAIKRVESKPPDKKAWDALGNMTKWSTVYPDVDHAKWRPELTALLDRLLAFLPSTRASATEALELPYFADWHDPEEEPVHDQSIDWSFDLKEMAMVDVRAAIYKECIAQDILSKYDAVPRVRRRSLCQESTGLTELPPPPAFLRGQSMDH